MIQTRPARVNSGDAGSRNPLELGPLAGDDDKGAPCFMTMAFVSASLDPPPLQFKTLKMTLHPPPFHSTGSRASIAPAEVLAKQVACAYDVGFSPTSHGSDWRPHRERVKAPRQLAIQASRVSQGIWPTRFLGFCLLNFSQITLDHLDHLTHPLSQVAGDHLTVRKWCHWILWAIATRSRHAWWSHVP